MRSHRLELTICLLLAVLILAVYWPLSRHDFINFDDSVYITQNTHVKAGLTKRGFLWAFTSVHSSNWHPLTWLSHMLDSQMFGLEPGMHHLTNLLFHMANSLLLFVLFRRMTGAIWSSAFVGALFALHPLHVESVAWISERKDVLSTFFWMITMWTYARYTESPTVKRYILVVICFALGLMAKPTVVTLPFVLLLLDYWPLGRVGRSDLGGNSGIEKSIIFRLIWEKAPLFVLTLILTVVTSLTIRSLDAPIRISNAVVAYVGYMRKMIWPHDLAVFYPYPGSISIWHAVGAGILLVCLSILFVKARQKRPYLVVGWFWYLGTLIPVIGLVQFGAQAMADRYTYVPLIGLFIIVAWGVPDLLRQWQHRKFVLAVLAVAVLAVLMVLTWMQVGYWRNSTALFTRALKVTTNNYLAISCLGDVLERQGRIEEAIKYYSQAFAINPHYSVNSNRLGLALARQGRLDDAISHFYEVLRIRSTHLDTHINLGTVLVQRGELDKAISHFSKAVKIKPDCVRAHYKLGLAHVRQGRLKFAIRHYSEALRIKPDQGETHNAIGTVLARLGKLHEAAAHFSEALRINPDSPEAQHNLARALRLIGGTSKTKNTVQKP